MVIRLKVLEQTLSIIDTRAIPRKGSKDYLVLQFLFSPDWGGLDKLCYLQHGEVSQPIDVVDNLVEVPEWFTQQDSFDVTLFGKSGSQEVPTNVVSLRLEKSNTLWEQDAPEPQPSWLAKVIDLNNHPPVPGENGYWLIWDTDKGAYVESELPLPAGGSGGTSDHSKLINRDAAGQHPMSAVTGLVEALDGKQPTGDYLTRDNLQSATNAALEQAKASGEFDGTDGTTPHIGDNGNWYLGDTDTGKPSRGETGAGMDIPGATVGQIAKITAVDDSGKPTSWEAVDMPTSLPNPNALTFTGAVTGSYDGSEAVTVDIPSGEGSTVNNNTINQYFYNSKVTGKYDLKSGYGTTADIYIAEDGTETAISGLYYVATDYIPVRANTAYVAYCNGYALYDREKTFVSAVIDRSNYGTIKEFTPEQDGYVRVTYRGSVFPRLCEKSEIKKAPRDYMPAPSPFFDIRIPCNVDLYGDSNSYGYGLSDTANAWSNRLGALLLSMPEKITNGARYEMSVFADSYNGDPKLGNNGVVYMSAYTDKFIVNGEYITAVDVYIDGVQQEQMTASPAEYTCPLGYHEIELRGSSGTNNVINSIATNKTRSFTNHAVISSKSGNLPDTVDGNVEIVMYGTNDRQIEYGNTAYNMARFYSACEAAGAKLYFLSPIPTTVEGETDASYVQTISDVISQIPDINYIDVYKDMQLYSLLSTETLYSDKLHLNDFGHKVLFCIVASKLHLAALNSIFGE